MANKKSISLALLDIMKKYTDENHILSANEIIGILKKEYGLELERRTLYSNLELLVQFGYSISFWEENGKGYFLQERNISKEDVFMLCDMILGSELSRKKKEKITDALLDELSVYQRQKYRKEWKL